MQDWWHRITAVSIGVKMIGGFTAVFFLAAAGTVLSVVALARTASAAAVAAAWVHLAITGLVTAAAGLLVGFALLRHVVRPMGELTRVAGRAAQGDLDLDMATAALDDEVGAMQGSFQYLLTSLRGLLQQLAGIAGRVQRAAGQVEEMCSTIGKVASYTAETGQSLEEQANRQATAAQEAGGQLAQLEEQARSSGEEASQQAETAVQGAQILNQMSEAIQDVASKAQAVAEAAAEAERSATEGGKVVGDNLAGVQKLRSVVEEATAAIDTLGERSSRIGEMVQLIGEIADQTNLLALNAAIEAARAGEHGRGFAVVADEVRRLADRSAQAAQEITTLVEEVARHTAAGVDAMNEGARQAKLMAERAGVAGEALANIINSVKGAADQVQGIAAATEELAASVTEVESAAQQSVEDGRRHAVSAAALTEGMSRVRRTLEEEVAAFTQTASTANDVSTAAFLAKDDAANLAALSESLEQIVAELGELLRAYHREVAVPES